MGRGDLIAVDDDMIAASQIIGGMLARETCILDTGDVNALLRWKIVPVFKQNWDNWAVTERYRIAQHEQ